MATNSIQLTFVDPQWKIWDPGITRTVGEAASTWRFLRTNAAVVTQGSLNPLNKIETRRVPFIHPQQWFGEKLADVLLIQDKMKSGQRLNFYEAYQAMHLCLVLYGACDRWGPHMKQDDVANTATVRHFRETSKGTRKVFTYDRTSGDCIDIYDPAFPRV